MSAYTSSGSGDFNSAATWGGGGWPQNAADTFVVSAGHTVTLTNDNTGVALGDSTVNGLLTFSTGATTGLKFGHNNLTIANGGEVRIGASGAIIDDAYTASLLFDPTSDNAKGLVIAAGGKLTTAGDPAIYGGAGSDEAALSADWTSGTSFTITGDFSAKWKDGQTLYVHKNSLYSALADTVLVTISGTPSYSAGTGLTTITVTGAPTFPTGGFKAGGKVLNPTRNVIIGKAGYTPTVSVSAVSNRPLCADANTTSGKISIADTELRAFYDGFINSVSNVTNNQFDRVVIRNCRYGISGVSGLNFSGMVACCQNYAIFAGINPSISGNIFANNYGFGQIYGYYTISADVFGNSTATYLINGANITGDVFSNSAGIHTSFGINFSGNSYYNADGFNGCYGSLVGGCVFGNTRGFAYCDLVITGKIGYNGSDTAVANTYDFRWPNYNSAGLLKCLCRGAKIGTPAMYQNNSGGIGSQAKNFVAFEDYQQVVGAHRVFLPTGEVIKNTSTVRSGGAASSLECIPYSNCAANAPLLLLEWTELDVPASEQTRSIYVLGNGWTSFPTNAQLYLEAEYYNAASGVEKTTVASTQVISDNVTWTALSVTFTPGQVMPVRYKAWLKTYESGASVFVDNKLY